MKSPNLLASFGFAMQGIVHTFRTQRNFKIHTAITLAVVAASLWAGLNAEQLAVLCVAIALVFVAELFNTALEAVVDHVSPEFHALAKVAKDSAAGAVFFAAMMAVVVGLLVIGPKLANILMR